MLGDLIFVPQLLFAISACISQVATSAKYVIVVQTILGCVLQQPDSDFVAQQPGFVDQQPKLTSRTRLRLLQQIGSEYYTAFSTIQ